MMETRKKRPRWWYILLGLLGFFCLLALLQRPSTRTPPEQATPKTTLPGETFRATVPAPTITPLPTASASTATPLPTAPAPTTTPPPTEEPTVAPPTETPEPVAVLRSLALRQYQDHVLTVTLEYGEARVAYDLGFQFDEHGAVVSAVYNFTIMAPHVFSETNAAVFILDAYAEFKDVYGNTSLERAFGFTMPRDVADKINWPEFSPRNLNLILTTEPGCVLYVHPSLQQAWNDYAAGR